VGVHTCPYNPPAKGYGIGVSPLAVQLLLAIGTAFLAAALGAIATGAAPSLLALFVGAAVVAGLLAIGWESRAVRSRLPFARPFEMRLLDLWTELDGLRKSPDGATHQAVAQLEGRIWAVIEREMPERAAVTEAATGGRLRPEGPLQSPSDIHHRLVILDTLLTRLIEEEA
jgi:hypothetical protein